MQRAALTLIGTGLRDFHNVTWRILRNCDSLQTLIGLYASGQTNSTILQELINLGVGTSSLQSTLKGVVQNLTSSLTAQSASSSVPADCVTMGNKLDDDTDPSDASFTAWYQKCSQYVTQYIAKDAMDWDDDWAQASNVRNSLSVLTLVQCFLTQRLQKLLGNSTSGSTWALNCNLSDWDDDWDNDKWDE